MPSQPVHVVVLAAGRGSRLRTLAPDRPKWLLEVDGRTIADRQLEGIEQAGAAVASAHVVVGHAGRAIADKLALRAPGIGLIDNPQFATLNNWWSLLLALRALPEGGPVAVINSDLLADPSAVAAFLTAAATGADDGLLVVDLERTLTDESMKVAQTPDGTLARIGKIGIEDAAGEYPGLLMARGDVLTRLRTALEAFVGHDHAANEWYEGAVGHTASEGAAWRLWPMPSSDWVEIDDDDDLELARALVAAP